MGLIHARNLKAELPEFVTRHFPFVDFNFQTNIKILEITLTHDRMGLIDKMLTCETTARVIEEKLIAGPYEV